MFMIRFGLSKLRPFVSVGKESDKAKIDRFRDLTLVLK